MHKLFILVALASLTACGSTMPLAQLDDSAILGDAVKETKRIAGEIVEEAVVAVRSDAEVERARLKAELKESIRRVRASTLNQIKKAPAKVVEKIVEPATIYETYDDAELRKWVSQVAVSVQRNKADADRRAAAAIDIAAKNRERLNAPPIEKGVTEEPAAQGGFGAFLVLLIAWIAREARKRIAQEFA